MLKIRLAAVPPAGVADFTPDPSLPLTVLRAGSTRRRPSRCARSSSRTIAISYAVGRAGDLVGRAHRLPHCCHGNQFDALANNIGEGWACIAVGTKDRAGNFSVSPPLRVYIEYDYDGAGAFGEPRPPIPAPRRRHRRTRPRNTVRTGRLQHAPVQRDARDLLGARVRDRRDVLGPQLPLLIAATA